MGNLLRFEIHLHRNTIDVDALAKRIRNVCVAFDKTKFTNMYIYGVDVLGDDNYRALSTQLTTFFSCDKK